MNPEDDNDNIFLGIEKFLTKLNKVACYTKDGATSLKNVDQAKKTLEELASKITEQIIEAIKPSIIVVEQKNPVV